MKHRLLRVALGFGMGLPTLAGAGPSNDGSPRSPEAESPQHPSSAVWLDRSMTELSTWANASGARVSALVVDLANGRSAALNPDLALNPASNMKLLTSAYALEKLGPTFTFRTAVFGTISSSGEVAQLALRGDGDPTLQESDLWRLANSLRHRGVRRINTLLVDQSAFDARTLPPAFEQQPRETAAFRAPVSAVAVERNTVTANVLPQGPNEPALVWFEPAGFVDVKGQILTVTPGSGQTPRVSLSPATSGRLTAQVAGGIAALSGRQRYTQRVDDPQLTAGHVLAHLLQELGIPVDEVRSGVVRDLPLISYISSPPLAQILTAMGKQSDNFTAEMVFKALSASPNGVASFDASSRLLGDWLAQRPACAAGFQVVNGSGLFDANRVSASCVVAVLRHAYERPEHRDVMLAQLAVGGTDGTLLHRFQGPALRGRVRAKTGTLNSVTALSGYVLREGTRAPVVFSLLLNEVANKHAEGRRLMDSLVAEAAR